VKPLRIINKVFWKEILWKFTPVIFIKLCNLHISFKFV